MATNRRVCAGDIGSNAIKVRVVEDAAGLRKTLCEARYPIRLGSGAFERGLLGSEEIDAAVGAFEEIAAMCRGFGVERTRIVATSAVREATNREEFTGAVEKHTGLAVEVISGLEEARLLAVGVRPDLKPEAHNLIIDIGGGSTEVIYTRTDLEVDTMHSMRLGAVRLHQMVKSGNPVTRKEFDFYRLAVSNMLENYHLPVIARHTHAIGVAGTVGAMLDVKRIRQAGATSVLTHPELRKILHNLRTLTADDMESKLGLERKRAPILIPGGLILDGIMDLYGIAQVGVSYRGLRDGIIEELVSGADTAAAPLPHEFAMRVGDKYEFDRAHSEHVARLADSLFDSLRPVHSMPDDAREILHFAALLHDIGQFVSYSRHHKHSYYLIGNEELPGLTPDRQQLVATVARYHRKSAPAEKHPEFQALTPQGREIVLKCTALLRIADALDREHRQLIEGIRVAVAPTQVDFHLAAKSRVLLEMSAARKKGELFEKLFGKKAVFHVANGNAKVDG